jgi:hypothetical protein
MPKERVPAAETTITLENPNVEVAIQDADENKLERMANQIASESEKVLQELDAAKRDLSAMEVHLNIRETHEKSPHERLLDACNVLHEGRHEKGTFYPRVGFPADGGAVEGQWVEVIRATPADEPPFTQVSFKLTAGHMEALTARIAQREISPDIILEDGEITFHPVDQEPTEFCHATVLKKDGIRIKISKARLNHNGNVINIRSALGLIHAEMPGKDLQQETHILSELMEELGINNCFGEPKKEDERAYKQARYAWHHKVPKELTDDQLKTAEDLTLEKVMPGYSVYTEKGKHREYQQIAGDFAFYHEASMPADKFAELFTSDGLLCTRVRFEGGQVGCQGLSSNFDLQMGGGDSVFTRLVTSAGIQASSPSSEFSITIPQIIFHPNIADRTDWYAYDTDNFGTTDPEIFENRIAPKELFERHAKGDSQPNNEQMFRHGLGNKDARSVVVSGWERERLNSLMVLAHRGLEKLGDKGFNELVLMDRQGLVDHYKKHKQALKMSDDEIEKAVRMDQRDKIIASFKERNMFVLNGIPIEEFVRYGETMKDTVEAATDKPWLQGRCIEEWRAAFNEELLAQKAYLEPSADSE